MNWLYVVRAFDATPVKVRFGSMQPLLAPVARYWWRDAVPIDSTSPAKPSTATAKATARADPTWSVVDRDEWMRRNPGRQPRSGTVELLGQTLACSWMQTSSAGVEVKTSESPVITPMFLSRANASTIFSALEKSFPGLTLAKLQDICKRVPLVSLALVGDQCGANGRAKHHVAHCLAVFNQESLSRGEGVVLLVDVNCCGHVIHGIVTKVFALKELMPRMHAIAFSLSIPNTYAKVVRALRRVVAEDLRIGFFPHTQPPAQFVAGTKTILDMTILRFKTARARCENLATTARESKREDLAVVLSKLLNGDWARPTLQHYCVGTCCSGHSRETAEEAITAALSEAFSSLSPRTSRPLSDGIPSGTVCQKRLAACSAMLSCPVSWASLRLSWQVSGLRMMQRTTTAWTAGKFTSPKSCRKHSPHCPISQQPPRCGLQPYSPRRQLTTCRHGSSIWMLLGRR